MKLLRLLAMVACLIVAEELNVKANIIRESSRSSGRLINPIRINSALPSGETGVPENYEAPNQNSQFQQATGEAVFEGYTCESDSSCRNGGQCIATTFGGSLCNCTIEWMGPQCELSSVSFILELRARPQARSSFTECLSATGLLDNVQALRVYEACDPGNTECWLREGGCNAIKVFFWCLNTDYRLLSERIPGLTARLETYSDAIRKLSRHHGSLSTSSLPQNPNSFILARLEEETNDENDQTQQNSIGTGATVRKSSLFNQRLRK